MNEERFWTLFFGALCGVAIMIIINTLWPMTTADQKEAVKQGHAEYYLDAKNERLWRWKEAR